MNTLYYGFPSKGYSVCSSDADGFLKGSACLADRGEESVAPVFLCIFFRQKKNCDILLLSNSPLVPAGYSLPTRPGFIMDAIIIKYTAHKISLDFLMFLLLRKRRFLYEHNHSIFLRGREREFGTLHTKLTLLPNPQPERIAMLGVGEAWEKTFLAPPPFPLLFPTAEACSQQRKTFENSFIPAET